jgi:hypothetical protein
MRKMNMKISKIVASVALAVASVAASAATSAVSVDATYLTTNKLTLAGTGGSTYTTGSLVIPVTTATQLLIDFVDAAGFSVKTSGLLSGTATFSNLTIDVATGTVFGDMIGSGLLAGLAYTGGQDLLTGTVSGLGTSTLTFSNFAVSSGFGAFLTDAGASPSAVPVGSIVKSITVSGVAVPAVPEPSTYAMLLLGLGGIAVAARRKQA